MREGPLRNPCGARSFRLGSVLRPPGLSIVGALLAAAVTAHAASGPAAKKEEGGFQTAAPHAILIDADNGNVLFEKNADALIEPASLAKLMTTEVVFNEIKEGHVKL